MQLCCHQRNTFSRKIEMLMTVNYRRIQSLHFLKSVEIYNAPCILLKDEYKLSAIREKCRSSKRCIINPNNGANKP